MSNQTQTDKGRRVMQIRQLTGVAWPQQRPWWPTGNYNPAAGKVHQPAIDS